MRIAVLLASFNRVAQTLECLRALKAQVWPRGTEWKVFLVDDASTDGTADRVAQEFPDVVVIRGTGGLYWCNSMRLAWSRSAQEDFDAYLWINDDTKLLPSAVQGLFDTWAAEVEGGRKDVIVVGSCRDPETGRHTYGGLLRPGRHPAKLVPVPPGGRSQPCDTFNGNFLLVPREVFRKLGPMRPFAHAIGDNDYGLIAREKGCRVVVAPGYHGECAHNPLGERFESMPLAARLRSMFGPKIFPPGSWLRYYWRHAGWMTLVYWPVSCLGRMFPRLRR